MFEIKSKDGAGRIGTLKTRTGKIETPHVFPVINPNIQQISPKEMLEKFKVDGIITNSYIIYRKEELREKALKQGIHKMLDYKGSIMTDSGAFQLMVYGDITVSNKDIIEFQDKIGVDIGVILDIPAKSGATYDTVKENSTETIKRAIEAQKYIKNSKSLWSGPIQGGKYPELVKQNAREIGKMNFKLNAIGSVVDLMNKYRYTDVVNAIAETKKALPIDHPVHLFGAGHPMFFALPVLLGVDLFDSAAYSLFAKDGRYLTESGTIKLDNLEYFPCNCEVCSKHSPDDLSDMEENERETLLSRHNLWVTLEEINRIKQSIHEGNLWEYTIQRCRSHPALIDALKTAEKHIGYIEELEPKTKLKGFFHTAEENAFRPEVLRHHKYMNTKYNPDTSKEILLILPDLDTGPYFGSPGYLSIKKHIDGAIKGFEGSIQEMGVVIPFGLVPREIDETYPLSQQSHPSTPDLRAEKTTVLQIKTFLGTHTEQYKHIIIYAPKTFKSGFNETQVYEKQILSGIWKDAVEAQDIESLTQALIQATKTTSPNPITLNAKNKRDLEKVRASLDYQFGFEIGKKIFSDNCIVERSNKTGKIQRIKENNELVAIMRAKDGFIIPKGTSLKKIHKAIPFPFRRITVCEEGEEFATSGKTIFSKFVLDCDSEIRAGDEVLVVNKKDKLFGIANIELCAREILEFNTGKAGKIR